MGGPAQALNRTVRKKLPMPWVRLDDRFPSHRKIATLDDRAFRLYISALCWCAENLTDGEIADGELHLVGHIRGITAAAKRLEDAGLWERTDGGWHIHDFLDYQYSAEQVRTERKKNAERQQRYRDRNSGKPKPPGASGKPPRNANSNGVTNGAAGPGNDSSVQDQRHDGDTNSTQTQRGSGKEPEVTAPRNGVTNAPPMPAPIPPVLPNGSTAASNARENPSPPDPFADLKAGLAAAGLGAVAWNITRFTDWQRIKNQLDRLGPDVMIRAAVNGARNRGEPDNVTAWIGRWESLPDPRPAGTADTRPSNVVQLPTTQALTGSDANFAGHAALTAQLRAQEDQERSS